MKNIVLFFFLILCTTSFGQQYISTVSSGAVVAKSPFTVGVIHVGSRTGMLGAVSYIIDKTVAFNDINIHDKYTVYPNPTNDLIYIKSSLNDAIDQAIITDAQGKIILKTSATENNLSSLPAGIYFVLIDGAKAFKILKN
jgi:hypothetical protein